MVLDHQTDRMHPIAYDFYHMNMRLRFLSHRNQFLRFDSTNHTIFAMDFIILLNQLSVIEFKVYLLSFVHSSKLYSTHTYINMC